MLQREPKKFFQVGNILVEPTGIYRRCACVYMFNKIICLLVLFSLVNGCRLVKLCPALPGY